MVTPMSHLTHSTQMMSLMARETDGESMDIDEALPFARENPGQMTASVEEVEDEDERAVSARVSSLEGIATQPSTRPGSPTQSIGSDSSGSRPPSPQPRESALSGILYSSESSLSPTPASEEVLHDFESGSPRPTPSSPSRTPQQQRTTSTPDRTSDGSSLPEAESAGEVVAHASGSPPPSAQPSTSLFLPVQTRSPRRTRSIAAREKQRAVEDGESEVEARVIHVPAKNDPKKRKTAHKGKVSKKGQAFQSQGIFHLLPGRVS